MRYTFAKNAIRNMNELLSEEDIQYAKEHIDHVSESPRERSTYNQSELEFVVECPTITITVSFQFAKDDEGEKMQIVSVKEGE